MARLRRARDLLAIQGYDTRGAVLACYGGNGFDDQLATAARAGEARLVEVADLYA